MNAQTNNGWFANAAHTLHTRFMCRSSVKIALHEPMEIPHSSAVSRTVSLLLLRTTVLTLAIVSSFLDVDGRPERGSLSKEVLPSLNRRNQSNACVRPIASSPYACCNNRYVSVAGFFFPILKQNLMQVRCSALSHIVTIAVTQTHVLLPRSIAANCANASTCNLCHELLRHVRTCQDWLQTHPTQWTATTIPFRVLFEQTSYILIFSTTSVSNIPHSKKHSARCYHNCTYVGLHFMWPILLSDF